MVSALVEIIGDDSTFLTFSHGTELSDKKYCNSFYKRHILVECLGVQETMSILEELIYGILCFIVLIDHTCISNPT